MPTLRTAPTWLARFAMAVEFIGRVEHVLIRPKTANPEMRIRGVCKPLKPAAERPLIAATDPR